MPRHRRQPEIDREPDYDDTSANGQPDADYGIDIDDDVGIESFEDGESYPLEDDGDDGSDE